MPSVLEVYERLKPHLGEDDTRLLVEFVQDPGGRGLATREDLFEVRTGLERQIAQVKTDLEHQIAQVKTDLEHQIAQVRTDLEHQIAQVRTDLAKVKADLHVEIAQVKAELLKWLFLFWVGQIGIVGGLLALFR